MSIQVLDPTHEADGQGFEPAPRLTSLQGKTVGLLSNGKYGTKPFFDAIERELIEEKGVAKVIRVTKGNYSAPAEAEIMADAETWDALFAGIGD